MEKRQYNEFIKNPSSSNVLINAGLIIGFIVLIISQLILFRMTTQQRNRLAGNVQDTSGNTINSDVILTSSDIQFVSCWDDGFSDAVAAVKPAIVNIDVVSSDVGPQAFRSGPALDFDMPPPQALKTNEETLGSGIIIDSRGYVLTCYHLIKDYPRVYATVFSSSRKAYKADIVYTDTANDLAVLKIYPDSPIPVAKLGDSDLVKITDTVLTIGSPFGFEHTVTAGIVSDNERSLVIDGKVYQNLFQTDASVNRGSAGGALINTNAEVIGVITAIASASEYFSGISFAVPINKAKSLLFKTIQ